MSNKQVSLTGIKPTGLPHIGNFLGAIKPALALTEKYQSRYFIADYHALNSIRDGEVLQKYILEIAATWLACGLDPKQSVFYKQSDVPEIFELNSLLMNFCAKGLMNRAHSYKATAAANVEAGKDPDAAVNMGLFIYPVLMSADILLFDTDVVPVGRDQVQHVEIAVEIARTFNHAYQGEYIKEPQALFNKDSETVVGLDGRKMSKSYDNTIPLFLPPKKLRKLLMKIVTNSQEIEEAKDPDESHIFQLFSLFASEDEIKAERQRYLAGGMGWGHAKQSLFEVMDRELSPLRERYEQIIADPGQIEKILKEGAAEARELAGQTLRRLRRVIGVDLLA